MQRRRALLACCGGCLPRRIDEMAWGTARRYARASPCRQTAAWPHMPRWGSMPCPVNLAIQTAPSAHRIRIAWTPCPDSAPALLQTVLWVFPTGPPGCSCPKNPVRRVSPPHGVKVCRLARGSSCPRLYQVVTTLPRCTLPNKSIRI